MRSEKPPEFRRRFKEDVQWRHLRVRILQPQPGSPVFGMSRPREFAQHSRGLRRRWRVSVADFSGFKEAFVEISALVSGREFPISVFLSQRLSSTRQRLVWLKAQFTQHTACVRVVRTCPSSTEKNPSYLRAVD
jgi:hypothetical protein